jgi:phosphoribosylformylglycinamidine cyclo-ligase
VNVAERARALRGLLPASRYRPPASHGRRVEAPGHYAGLLRIGHETIAITTDTVGTKVLLAEEMGRWEEVGEDVVGVNVNDLASMGARTAGLVDVIVCARPDSAAFRGIGRGLLRGLRRAECSLLGGETAIVPSIVRGIDLGGTAFGFYPEGRSPVTGSAIRPGDVILGIPSEGVHANGFTLIRRLLRRRSVDLRRPRPGGKTAIGRELLRPTRIYTRATDAVADDRGLHGLAHLSGGGVRNLVRLRRDVRYVLDAWPDPPDLFRWVQQLGEVADREMFQTFNMGIGFAVVAARHRASDLLHLLGSAGAGDTQVIGHVERGHGVELPTLGLRYEGYQ